MQFKELILRVLIELETLIPLVLVIMGVTLLLLLFLVLKYRKLKLENRKGLSGLFFGLSKFNSLQLALSYLKGIIIVYYVISFKELSLIDYVTIGLCSAAFSFANKNIGKILENLFWTATQALGLIAIKFILGYVFKDNANSILIYLYFGLVIIMILYSIYLFWNEVAYISNLRDINPELVFKNKEAKEINNERE